MLSPTTHLVDDSHVSDEFLHDNGLRILAITSLPPVTQLTGQHAILLRS
jgi:hypothetical protein